MLDRYLDLSAPVRIITAVAVLAPLVLLVASAAFTTFASRPAALDLLTDIQRAANDLVASGRGYEEFRKGVDNLYLYANGSRLCAYASSGNLSTKIVVPLVWKEIDLSLGRLESSPVCREIPGMVSFKGEGFHDGVVKITIRRIGKGLEVSVEEVSGGEGS